MSTATDKAIPTWGEVKNIASQKQYHWMWYYDITSVSTTAATYTYTDAQSLNGNTGFEHSSVYPTLFQLSLGNNWEHKTNGYAANNVYPIHSCILPPCYAVHGKVFIPDCSVKYNSNLTLNLTNIKLNLYDLSYKNLSFKLASSNNGTLTDARIFWEVQQLTTV